MSVQVTAGVLPTTAVNNRQTPILPTNPDEAFAKILESVIDMLVSQEVDTLTGSHSTSSTSAVALNSSFPFTLRMESMKPTQFGAAQQAYANQIPTGDTNLSNLIQDAASKYQIPENLLRSVIQQESSFNPNAQSSVGAMGLMQLMPETAQALGVTNAFDPAQNINAGAKYLRQLMNQFGGNVSLALAAYNAGPEAVEKYNGIPPYKETQSYVQDILSRV